AGIVLYECLAGRTPWEASSCPALLRAIVDEPAPPLLGVRGCDAELWAILDRALAKNRVERWPSAREFGAALAAWLCEREIGEDISGASVRSEWLARQSSCPALGAPAVRRSSATLEGGPILGKPFAWLRSPWAMTYAAVLMLVVGV